MRGHPRLLAAIATSALFGAAVYVMRGYLTGSSLPQIEAAAARVPRSDLSLALLLTAASYATMTLYDVIALHLVRKRVPYRRIALTSFIAYGLANTVGLSSLSGGSVRLRAYTAEGLTALQVASVQALCSATFVLGAIWVSGGAMLLDQHGAAAALHLPLAGVRALGTTLLLLVAAYAIVVKLRRRPLRLHSWSIELPSLRDTLLQLALSSFDLACAAACLYVLLPPIADLSFLSFLAAYVLAIVAGTVSNVPGGLGVFESTLVLLLPSAPVHELLGAVLVYRLVYYLLPFLVALALLVLRELLPLRAKLRASGRAALRRIQAIAPQVLAMLAFAAGAVLLIWGTLPSIGTRVPWLRLVALPRLEVSHVARSALGVLLLIAGNGLYGPLDAAYWLTQLLLALAISASLLKGFAYEDALLLSLVMLLLSRARRRFEGRAPPFEWRSS